MAVLRKGANIGIPAYSDEVVVVKGDSRDKGMGVAQDSRGSSSDDTNPYF